MDLFDFDRDDGAEALRAGYEYYRQQDFPAAMRSFLAGARAGNLTAMNNVAMFYARGIGTPADAVKSFQWMKRAADGGNTDCYYNLAVKYYKGSGTERDMERAEYWATQAAAIPNKDPRDANALLERIAAELPDDGQREFRQGCVYDQQGDAEHAFPLFLTAAEKGHPMAMYNVALAYDSGSGVGADPAAGFGWMLRAAEQGVAPAMLVCARHYLNKEVPGQVVYPDLALEQAGYWAGRAWQEHRIPEADEIAREASLAADEMERSGFTDYLRGVRLAQEQNYDNVFPYAMSSAEVGCADGMHLLSGCFESGWGTAADAAQAFIWERKAAYGGCVYARLSLAKYYYQGFGTEPDPAEAEFWARQSAIALQDPESAKLCQQIRDENPGMELLQYPAMAEFREGLRCLEGGDHDGARRNFETAASFANGLAMAALARMYLDGMGVDRDPAAAFGWAQESAGVECADGYALMAQYCARGIGTPVDGAAALEWAQKLPDGMPEKEELLNLAKTTAILNAPADADLSGLNPELQGVEHFRDNPHYKAKEAAPVSYGASGDADGSAPAAPDGDADIDDFFDSWQEDLPGESPAAPVDFDGLFSAAPASQPAAPAADDGEEEYQDACLEMQKGNRPKALQLFVASARKGHVISMNNAGTFYLNGTGTQPNDAEAFRWLRMAAEHGYENAYAPLTRLYAEGKGTRQNLAQAEFWARKLLAVPGKQEVAQRFLTDIHRVRLEKGDTDNALTFPPEIVRAYEEGQYYFEQQRYGEAIPRYITAARAGHPQALTQLGVCYVDGRGLPADYDKGAEYLLAAIYRGNANAARGYALTSNGVAANIWKAYSQDKKLAGCDNLFNRSRADVIQEHQYVSVRDADDAVRHGLECLNNARRDPARHGVNAPTYDGIGRGVYAADHYLVKAAMLGNLDALCADAEVLEMCSDRATALHHLKLAAYCGHSYAMYRVAQYYEHTDPATAAKCYAQAARWNYGPAVRLCQMQGIRY